MRKDELIEDLVKTSAELDISKRKHEDLKKEFNTLKYASSEMMAKISELEKTLKDKESENENLKTFIDILKRDINTLKDYLVEVYKEYFDMMRNK